MSTKDFTVSIECRICKKDFDINCEEKDYSDWKSGKGYIQDLLNYLSASDRELILSETCGNCFDQLFPSEED